MTHEPPKSPARSLTDLAMDELRYYRNELMAEEDKVSYWRRLVQHRINLINKERSDGHLRPETLMRALGATGTGARRQQFLSVSAEGDLPALPALNDLWTQPVDLDDDAAVSALLSELGTVEGQLSAYRRSIHSRLDVATTELVERYKKNPSMSLTLFSH